MKKRLLSLFLTVAMLCSVLPFTFAASSTKIATSLTVNLEAENAVLHGGKILTDGTSKSGTGYVGDFYVGSTATFNVTAQNAGTYTLAVRAGTQQNGGRAVILVDDQEVDTLDISNTGGWQNYRYHALDVELTAGDHAITVKNASATWNLDCMVIYGAGNALSSEKRTRIEAEDYTAQSGTKVLSNNSSCSGGKYVGDYHNGDTLSYGLFAETAGLYQLVLTAASQQDGACQVQVAGQKVDCAFQQTKDWQRYVKVGVVVELPQGYSSVTLLNTLNVWNLDYLELVYLQPQDGYVLQKDAPLTVTATNWATASGIWNQAANVGSTDLGDWFDYMINVEEKGIYTVTMRVACGNQVGAPEGIHVVTRDLGYGAASVPITGDWQEYVEVSTQIKLLAGQQMLRFYVNYEGWNLKDFTITYEGELNNVAPMGYAFDDGNTEVAKVLNDGLTGGSAWTGKFAGIRYDRAQSLNKAVLFGDEGLTGRLVFSDGSVIENVQVTPDGTVVDFEAKQVYWARFEPNGAGSLTELELHGEPVVDAAVDLAMDAHLSTSNGFKSMRSVLGHVDCDKNETTLNYDTTVSLDSLTFYGLPATVGDTFQGKVVLSSGETYAFSVPVDGAARQAKIVFDKAMADEVFTIQTDLDGALSYDAVCAFGVGKVAPATSYMDVQVNVRWGSHGDEVFSLNENNELCYVSVNGDYDKGLTLWNFINLGDNTYLIQNAKTGGYLVIEDGASVVTCKADGNAQASGKWAIQAVTADYYAISNAANKNNTLHVEHQNGMIEISGAQSHWHSANWALTVIERAYHFSPNRVDDSGKRAIANTGTSITTNYGGTESTWTLKRDISDSPVFKAPNMPIIEAVYNRTMEETYENTFDGEYGPVFNTGTNWNFVWTRDTAMSVQYSLAWIYPDASKNCALEKVLGDDTTPVYQQDTGTGGSYPVSTDRIITTLSVWEQYLTTGDKGLLEEFYKYTENTINQDLHVAFDPETGLFKGETGGLDHRDKTYPDWMSETNKDSLANIAESKSSIVNIIYCQVYEIMARSAELLGYGQETVEKWQTMKQELVDQVNEHFWDADRGLYVSWEYPNYMGAPTAYKYDVISNGYAVMYGIADQEQCKAITENYPLVVYGADTVYPQKNGRQGGTIYHNRGIWPGWEATLMIGAAQEGNNQLSEEIWKSCLRGCAMTLTNYEVINFNNGNGVASRNQLWSIAATLSGYYRVLYGMEYTEGGIVFRPYVPEWMYGPFELSNYPYRDATLNLKLSGTGDKLVSVKLDGVEMGVDYVLPTDLTGAHTVELVVEDSGNRSEINLSDYNHVTCPDLPVLNYADGVFTWNDSRYTYKLWDGQQYRNVSGGSYTPDPNRYGVYSLVAVAEDGIESELSAPITVNPQGSVITVEAEDGTYDSSLFHASSATSGTGYVVSDAKLGAAYDLSFDVTVETSGDYSLSAIYNNRGDSTSGDYCAIRSVYVDGEDFGTMLFPVMSFDWTRSTHLTLHLTAGTHTIRVVYDDDVNWYNTNMNALKANNHQSISLDCFHLELMQAQPELAVVQQPAAFAGSIGDTAVFTVAVNRADVTYQWYFSNNGGKSWAVSALTGADTATVTVPMKAYRVGQMYKCVIADSEGNVVETETVSMTTATAGLAIVKNPADYTGAVGTTATFAVEATGEGLCYQWMYSNNGGLTYVKSTMPGSTTATVSVTVKAFRNGQMYQCVVTDASGNVVQTAPATLVVG